MQNYYRIMLGRKNVYADEAYKGSFIGAGFFGGTNLTQHLPDNGREFNKQFIPIYLGSEMLRRVAARAKQALFFTLASILRR